MFDARPSWQAHALGNTGDASLVDVFFGRGRHDFDGVRAKQICAACPVQPDCLDYALTVADAGSEASDGATRPAPGSGGVFGGLTHLERIELRRQLEGAA